MSVWYSQVKSPAKMGRRRTLIGDGNKGGKTPGEGKGLPITLVKVKKKGPPGQRAEEEKKNRHRLGKWLEKKYQYPPATSKRKKSECDEPGEENRI